MPYVPTTDTAQTNSPSQCSLFDLAPLVFKLIHLFIHIFNQSFNLLLNCGFAAFVSCSSQKCKRVFADLPTFISYSSVCDMS